MRIEKTELGEIPGFPPLFIDYLKKESGLNPFFGHFPSPDSFPQQINSRNFDPEKRKVLFEVLTSQYQGIDIPDQLQKNLDSIKQENTYTITTGHQLNLFTGPLYFIYKIVTIINACRKLNQQYPDHHFVPVYWMASEDHDFEEINHFNLFGSKYVWETDQKGGVGRFDTSSLKELIDQLPEKPELFSEAYTKNSNLADATRHLVNGLFGAEGLVVLNPDDSQLKGIFSQWIRDDLLNHRANDMVQSTSDKLVGKGYKAQIHPRAINFFYLDQGIRERIIREDGKFMVRNSELKFSEEDILAELDQHPERFSPNVVFRPLYQELILPNLAYVGGPAEIAYWLQLKIVFDHYEVPFPILMPRNFGVIISKGLAKKIEKLRLSSKDLMLSLGDLKAKVIQKENQEKIGLEEERALLSEAYKALREKARKIDQSLEGMVGAEESRSLKGLENLEKRLQKGEESKFETSIQQVAAIKEKLFPSGNLQERTDNILNFYINNPQIIEQLLAHLDPFDYRFNVLIDE